MVIQKVEEVGDGMEMLEPLQLLRGKFLPASQRLSAELGMGCTPLTPKSGKLRQADL